MDNCSPLKLKMLLSTLRFLQKMTTLVFSAQQTTEEIELKTYSKIIEELTYALFLFHQQTFYVRDPFLIQILLPTYPYLLGFLLELHKDYRTYNSLLILELLKLVFQSKNSENIGI